MSYASIALNVFVMWCLSVMFTAMGLNLVVSTIVCIPVATLALVVVMGSAWIVDRGDVVFVVMIGLCIGCLTVLANAAAMLVTGDIYTLIELAGYFTAARLFESMRFDLA